MKILNLYIGKSLLTTTLLAIAILTFVLVSANLFQAFELLARGVPITTICSFVLYMLPFALQFAIPLAILCSAVLVFSRLSADNEVTAMRASGISLWQIISPGLLLAAILSGLCVFLQAQLAPECRYQASLLRQVESVRNPASFLESGRYVEFPGHIVYVGKRDGSQLEDIQIYVMDRAGRVRQDVTARTGELDYNEESETLTLALHNVVIGEISHEENTDTPKVRHSSARDMSYQLNSSKQFNRRRLTRRPKHMDVPTILSTIYIYNLRGDPTNHLYLELHKRMSLAFSPIGFLLMGIPFGIRTRRSETSVGLVVALILAMVFYVFLALSESLADYGRLHSEILVWIPNVVYQAGGLIALYRLTKK